MIHLFFFSFFFFVRVAVYQPQRSAVHMCRGASAPC
jgi:hypothetical protein